jgi:Tfp pilus assembly protein PilX
MKPLRQLFRRRLFRNEQGFALVIALAVTVVFSMTVITIIESAASNSRSSDRSKGRISAYSLAEAGINNAASILGKSNAYDQHLLHPQGTYQPADCASPPANPSGAPLLGNTCSVYTWTYDGGTTTMWGWLNSANSNWTIISTGQVRNAFGGAPTQRTLTATVHVRAAPSQTNYVTAWNYVFVMDTTPNVCNLSLDQTTNFAVSTYVAGNLCFRNSAYMAETDPTNPINLEVRGKIVYLNPAAKGVGDTSLPSNGQITTAKIGGGCDTAITGTGHTCAPPGDYFYVKPGGYSTTAPPISAPMLTNTDFTNYYNTAYIRPGLGCDNPGPNGATRLANSTFDNDTTPLNGAGGNGSAALFDLTPASNYTCEVKDSAGKVIAELTWDNTSKLLKIRGTIYIDGSVMYSQAATYQGVNSSGVHPAGDLTGKDGIGGKAVLYLSGTFSSFNTPLCGWDTVHDQAAVTGGVCDFSKWTPNTSMLMIVAHGSPDGVNFGGGSGCYFQGAIYAMYNVALGQQCRVEGPVIAATLTVGQGVSMKPLPGITDLPVGAPGNPNTAGIPEAPTYGGG